MHTLPAFPQNHVQFAIANIGEICNNIEKQRKGVSRWINGKF
jgi:hypothetical protein